MTNYQQHIFIVVIIITIIIPNMDTFFMYEQNKIIHPITEI